MNNKPKSFWQRYAWAGVVVLCLATYAVLQSSWLMDTLKGWGYEPAEKVVAIESDLQLTAAHFCGDPPDRRGEQGI